MAKHQDYPALIGAVLLAAALLATALQATPMGSRAYDPGRLPSNDNDDGERWTITTDLQAEVLARLPEAFERRAREAREHVGAGAVPPLSGYDVQLQGRTSTGGRRMVVVDGSCKPLPPVAASSAAAVSIPETCYFGGAYDPGSHRFVQLSFGNLQPAYETGQVDCAADRFQAATRLADLPPEVLAALQARSRIADHGVPFRKTDVVTDRHEPSRGFALAAVSADRAIVAVEHGGYFYSVENWLFERRNGHWDGEPRWQGGLPNSVQALLHMACVGFPAPPTRDPNTADLIVGYDEPEGLELVIESEREPGYVLRHDVGQARDEIFPRFEPDKPLSADARRALHKQLLALRADVLPDQPAWAHLTRLIDALERDPR